MCSSTEHRTRIQVDPLAPNQSAQSTDPGLDLHKVRGAGKLCRVLRKPVWLLGSSNSLWCSRCLRLCVLCLVP